MITIAWTDMLSAGLISTNSCFKSFQPTKLDTLNGHRQHTTDLQTTLFWTLPSSCYQMVFIVLMSISNSLSHVFFGLPLSLDISTALIKCNLSTSRIFFPLTLCMMTQYVSSWILVHYLKFLEMYHSHCRTILNRF